MKFAVLFSILFISGGCTFMKQISNQGENTITGNQKFQIENDFMIVKADFDNQQTDWIFDTGTTISTIFNSEYLNEKETFNVPFGKTKAADGSKIETKAVSADFENSFMKIEKKLFAIIPTLSLSENEECKKEGYSNPIGLMGMDIFYDNDSFVEINFIKNQIAVHNQESFSNLIGDLKPLDTKIKNGNIYLNTMIDGNIYSLLLDTGFKGYIVLPYSESGKIDLSNSIEYEGILFRSASNIDQHGKVIESAGNKISFDDFKFESNISLLENINSTNIGLKFIQNFNWYVDFKNERLYVQMINNSFSNEEIQSYDYKAAVKDGELRIVKKKKVGTKYHLNDVILSVNGIQVAPENICQFQNELNQNTEWDNFQIEIKK